MLHLHRTIAKATSALATLGVEMENTFGFLDELQSISSNLADTKYLL